MTQNKKILVTGAGSGIGQAIAKQLARQQYTLVLLGRNPETLKGTRDQLENPDNHQCILCDICVPEQIRDALSQSDIGSLYGIVANAGIARANIYGEGDTWQEVIDTNLTGSYNTVQECLPYLKKNGSPFRKILFISSVLAQVGAPGYSAYCASKTGLLGLMRSMAVEYASENILVNAICPGFVDTDMAHGAFEGLARAMDITREAAMQMALSESPLGKMARAEEVAQLVNFVLSEDQTSITGQALNINNGAYMT